MNPMEAASPPPIPLGLRRARLRARPSGLKGRCRDRYATGCGPPLTPEPLRSLTTQRYRAGAWRCPPSARRRQHQQDQNPYNQVSTVLGDCH
jgi:hypothetical protein